MEINSLKDAQPTKFWGEKTERWCLEGKVKAFAKHMNFLQTRGSNTQTHDQESMSRSYELKIRHKLAEIH